MELEALKETLRAAKLHPVHVEGSPLDTDVRGHTFIGSLEEYSDAVRAIGTPIVLILTETLEEQRFRYAPANQDEFSTDETEPIDLCSITPGLRAYKTHIGEIAMYKLSAALTNGTLNLFINEPWWLEFIKLWENATDQLDDNQAATEAQSKAEQQAKDRDALNALGALIRDPDFVRLPTQKAMIAYATEKIPELETVDEFALRAEVQNLHAKIKAKGLGRKR
jgi:hypothetical protein